MKLSAALATCFALALPATAVAGPLLLSEVLYDASGSDQARVFVELWGPAGLGLDDYLLEGVNGSNGAIGPVLTLSGVVPADGFFVVADAASGATEVANADLLLDFDFQNGPDSIVLRGPGGQLLDALGYGSFAAGEVFAGEGQPAEDPPAGQSVAREFANLDTNDNAADFAAQAVPTPGTGALALPEPRLSLLLLACLTPVLLAHFRSR